MSIPILEKILGKQAEREQAKTSDWWRLVRTIGDGREPDVDAVDRTLTDLGKNVDDLRAAVELYQRRKALREKIDAATRSEKRLAEIAAEIAAADAELTAAQERHAAKVNPLAWERQAINDRAQEARNGEGELVNTCPYPEIGAAQRANERGLRDVERQITELRKKIDLAGSNASTSAARAELADGSLASEYREDAANAEKRREGYRAELARLEALKAQLVAEGEAIHRRKLEP